MRTRKTRERGMALVAVMGVLMIILAMFLVGITTGSGTGALGRVGTATMATRRRANVYVAQGLAENAMRLTLQWINEAPILTKPVSAFAPSSTDRDFYGASVVSNYNVLTLQQGVSGQQVPGTMKVRIYPYTSNSINNRRIYVIETIGEFFGAQQIIRAVVAEKTFARYAFFADTAPTNYWVSGNTAFNGPVHINGLDSSGNIDSSANINILWKSAGPQIFRYNGAGSFTTSLQASQIRWQKDSALNYVAPSTSSEWNQVMATGAAPQTGVAPVTMPTSSSAQYEAALGPSGTEPGSSGVVVPNDGTAATGGIFIKGDVDKMVLTASGTGSVNQGVAIYQTIGSNEVRTTVTVNPTTNTTTILKESRVSGSGSAFSTVSTDSYTGTTNGVVYCTGNIGDPVAKTGGISGVVANNVMSGSNVTRSNSLSIVTDAAKNMNINGGIVYADQIASSANPNNITSTASAASTTSGTLGLVSKNVQVMDNDAGGNPLTDVSVHATVFSYGTFDVTNPGSRPTGQFKLIGGYIVKTNGTFGQFDSSTGTMRNGFVVTRNYDVRAANNPPPYFPNEDNEFMLTSFQRVSSTLQ